MLVVEIEKTDPMKAMYKANVAKICGSGRVKNHGKLSGSRSERFRCSEDSKI